MLFLLGGKQDFCTLMHIVHISISEEETDFPVCIFCVMSLYTLDLTLAHPFCSASPLACF